MIGANDREAQHRLVRHLRRELDRRREPDRAARNQQPRLVVLVDNVGAFLSEHEDLGSQQLRDDFERLFSEGPGVDIEFVVAGDRLNALPMRMSSLVSQRVVCRLADPGDFSAIGVRSKNVPTFVPGRAILAEDHRVVQIALPGDLEEIGARLERRHTVSRPPRPIRGLPTEIGRSRLPRHTALTASPPELVVGLRDEDRGAAALPLHEGEHLLVVGPPRSGKTTALATMALELRDADPTAVVMAVTREGSALYDAVETAAPTLEPLAGLLEAALANDRPWFVLVDDAPRVEDTGGALTRLAESSRPGLHVIAAGRSTDVRGTHAHWLRQLRRSRSGLLLQPDLAGDGDLLGARLPRRLHVPLVPGRSFLVTGGGLTLCQIAVPDD